MSHLERAVPLPTRPLSPFLRLAHIWSDLSILPKPTDQVSLRTLRDFELILALEGRPWLWVEELGGSLDIQPGEVVFLPPGFVHAWGSAPETHLAVHFDLHAQPQLAAYDNVVPLRERRSCKPIVAAMTFSLQLQQAGQDAALRIPLVSRVREVGIWRAKLGALVSIWTQRANSQLRAQLRVNQVLTWAVGQLSGAEADSQRTVRAETLPGVMKVLSAVDHPSSVFRTTRPTVRELAALARMGETAFREGFRKVTGKTPHRYLEERRMHTAMQMLLNSGDSVQSIARAVGYDDRYHFSRAFKRIVGVSPRSLHLECPNRRFIFRPPLSWPIAQSLFGRFHVGDDQLSEQLGVNRREISGRFRQA